MSFEKVKKQIPTAYHFLLNGRMINTDTLEDKYRIPLLNRADFNRCERCGYDLLDPSSYKVINKKDRHPYKGFVHYWDEYKLVLCDGCLDELKKGRE